MKQKGYNILLAIGEDTKHLKVVAYGTNCTLNVNKEMIEVAGTDQGQTREYIGGLSDWNLQADGLYAVDEEAPLQGSASLIALCLNAKEVYAQWQELNEARTHVVASHTGKVLLSSFTAGAPKDGRATYSFTAQGSGTLAVATTAVTATATIDMWKTPDTMDVEGNLIRMESDGEEVTFTTGTTDYEVEKSSFLESLTWPNYYGFGATIDVTATVGETEVNPSSVKLEAKFGDNDYVEIPATTVYPSGAYQFLYNAEKNAEETPLADCSIMHLRLTAVVDGTTITQTFQVSLMS